MATCLARMAWQNALSNSASQARFMYDGEGQWVEQYTSSGSSNYTNYLPGNVEEVTPSGTLIKYYTAGGMQIGVNTTHDASGISYLASDGLGSVSEALSPSGTATGAQLYSPYGGVRYSTGAMPTAKGFTGQYSDASTGLDYYGARYYDPNLGQFTSADTVNDGLNRYGYVKGNPETLTDPTGHCPWCIIGAIAGAVVGAAVVYTSQVVSNVQNGGSLSDASTWAPTDWGAIGKGALIGAVVGGTMGAAGTAVMSAAGVTMWGVSEATAATASDVVFNSALGAGEGAAQGFASGDTGGDLLYDAAVGSASENIGYFGMRGLTGYTRANGIKSGPYRLDENTRFGSITTGVVSNGLANVTSQLLSTGRVDPLSLMISVGLGTYFGNRRYTSGSRHLLDFMAGGVDFMGQTMLSDLRSTIGSLIVSRPPQQIHDGRSHPW